MQLHFLLVKQRTRPRCLLRLSQLRRTGMAMLMNIQMNFIWPGMARKDRAGTVA